MTDPTITRLEGENRVLRELLRSADYVLETAEKLCGDEVDSLAGLRLSIACALAKPGPDPLDGSE